MWNYSFEIPVLMILAIILAFYFSRPRLPIRKNHTFMCMILIETLTIVIDISASFMDNDHAVYSIAALKVINMLYFMAFFCRSYMMYLFSASVLRALMHKNRLMNLIISLPFYFGIVVSALSMLFGSASFPHVLFYIDENGFHSGSIYNLVYVCGFYHVLIALIFFILYGKNLGRRREKYGILIYNLIILASLVIRLTLPQYLIMDTVIMMAILFVYLAFGNPEFYLDLKGTAFNRVAMEEHFEENKEKLGMVPLGISIHSFHEMRNIYGSSQMEEGLTMIARYLKGLFPKGIIFYCRNGRFFILDHPGMDTAGKINEITERFRSPWKSDTAELYLSAGFVTFEIIKKVYPSEIVLSSILRALETVGKTDIGETLKVTEEDIHNMETEKWVRQCIEKVLDSTGFELFLQPIVDAKTGRIKGAEALSRIRDDEGKIIPPGIFIPVAENSGRINGLGELVFDRACNYIKETDPDNKGTEWINVNLSPLQFLCTNLADRFSDIVKKYGIDPKRIHLEITEESMVDERFLQRQIKAMTEKGFIFVLDDYGTGYSNISRLKRCPFSNVKLDMSLVWDYCREPDDILPNMIQALKNMGFQITAEGIEDENMEKTMREIGCDLLQGFHYSKPVPADEFREKYHAL